MNKKNMSFIILVLAVFVFVGCDSKSNDGKTEVTVWTQSTEGNVQAMEKLIAEYESQNEDIKIVYESFPDFFQKVSTAFDANNVPDVILMYGSTQAYAKGGKLTPVPEDILTKEEMENLFIEETLKNRLTDDKYYGIPIEYNVESPGLILNLNLFEEAGVEVPQSWIDNNGPANWDEVVELAEKLTVYDNGGIVMSSGLSYLYSQYESMFASLIWQLGGDFRDEANLSFNFDTPEAKQAIEFMQKYTQEPYKFQEVAGAARYEILTNGTGAMVVGAPWYAGSLDTDFPDIKFQYFNLPPFIEESEPYFLGEGGWGYAVPSESKIQDEAWKFVKFLTEKESTDLTIDSLASISARKDSEVEDNFDVNVGSGQKARYITGDIIEFGRDGGSYCLDTSTLIWTIIRQNLNSIIVGEVSIDEGLATMNEQANKLAEDNLKR